MYVYIYICICIKFKTLTLFSQNKPQYEYTSLTQNNIIKNLVKMC